MTGGSDPDQVARAIQKWTAVLETSRQENLPSTSIKDIARDAGLSEQSVAAAFDGEKLPDANTARALAQVLDSPVVFEEWLNARIVQREATGSEGKSEEHTWSRPLVVWIAVVVGLAFTGATAAPEGWRRFCTFFLVVIAGFLLPLALANAGRKRLAFGVGALGAFLGAISAVFWMWPDASEGSPKPGPTSTGISTPSLSEETHSATAAAPSPGSGLGQIEGGDIVRAQAIGSKQQAGDPSDAAPDGQVRITMRLSNPGPSPITGIALHATLSQQPDIQLIAKLTASSAHANPLATSDETIIRVAPVGSQACFQYVSGSTVLRSKGDVQQLPDGIIRPSGVVLAGLGTTTEDVQVVEFRVAGRPLHEC